MEKNITLKPLNTVFFGTDTVMTHPHRIVDLIKQPGWFHMRLPASLAVPFRLYSLQLSRYFNYILVFYAPEKASCQRACRVPAYSYV